MSAQRLVGKIQRQVADRGLPGAVTYCARRLLRGQLAHPFDRQYGTKTGGLISGGKLAAGHPHGAYSTAYYGIAPSLFRQLCQRWIASLTSAEEVGKYTFVDIGAGKGRALLLASELPFCEVVGVELNAGLVEVAEKNIQLWMQMRRDCAPIRIVLQEATEFEWPGTPLVVYLFSPFGQLVLERLIARLLASYRAHPRPIDLLYVTPEHRSVLDHHEAFEPVWSEHLCMDRADRAADLVSSAGELCHAYRVKMG